MNNHISPKGYEELQPCSKRMKIKEEPTDEGDFQPCNGNLVEPKVEADADNDETDYRNTNVFKDAWGAMEHQFFCDVCDATMNNTCVLKSHIEGKRHKRKCAALKYVPAREKDEDDVACKIMNISGAPPKMYTKQLDSDAEVQQFMNDYRDSPLIGLDYIVEISLNDEKMEPVYQCSLCPADCQVASIISHVVGAKHRLSYMRLCDPRKYRNLRDKVQNSRIKRTAHTYAEMILETDGPGKMMAERQITSQLEIAQVVQDAPNRILPKYPPSAEANILSKFRKMEDCDVNQFIECRLLKLSANPNLSAEHLEQLKTISNELIAKFKYVQKRIAKENGARNRMNNRN